MSVGKEASAGSAALKFPWTDNTEVAWIEWDSSAESYSLRELVIVERDGYDVWDGDETRTPLEKDFVASVIHVLSERGAIADIHCDSEQARNLLERMSEMGQGGRHPFPDDFHLNGAYVYWNEDHFEFEK